MCVDDRHMRAVLAYCHELCGSEEAEDLAHQVASALQSADGGDDREVLETTQQLATSHIEWNELEGDWQRMLESVREARATRAFIATLEGPEAEPAIQDRKSVV